MEKTNGLRYNNYYIFKENNDYFYSEDIDSLESFKKSKVSKLRKEDFINVTKKLKPFIKKYNREIHVNYINQQKGGNDEIKVIGITSGGKLSKLQSGGGWLFEKKTSENNQSGGWQNQRPSKKVQSGGGWQASRP